jgi:glycosyltransferase involved in cell wall biosynthesis
MRIAFDARASGDFGIGTHIRNLVRALGQTDRENEYFIICSQENKDDFQGLPPNFQLVHYRGADRGWRDHVAFPHFLGRFKADLHHIPVNRVPILMRQPYVVTIHDMGRLVYSEQQGIEKQYNFWKRRRGLLRAERVIAVSNATQRDVETAMGITPEKITRIYDALDQGFVDLGERQRPFAKSVLERYGVTYPYVLYAGSIRPQKNVPRLIEAFTVLRGELAKDPVTAARFADLRWIVIGGDSSQNPAVRVAVSRTRSSGYVRFFGFVSQETLRTFYENAATFAFPSLNEGFGLPPLEAMECGTPVLTSNVSSLPEVVGDAAVMVNPDNVFEIARGLKEILTDDALRTRLVAAGHEQVKRFSWERTARETIDVYRRAHAGS